jgi:hypothetical protein
MHLELKDVLSPLAALIIFFITWSIARQTRFKELNDKVIAIVVKLDILWNSYENTVALSMHHPDQILRDRLIEKFVSHEGLNDEELIQFKQVLVDIINKPNDPDRYNAVILWTLITEKNKNIIDIKPIKTYKDYIKTIWYYIRRLI